jgi:hypothetical protein
VAACVQETATSEVGALEEMGGGEIQISPSSPEFLEKIKIRKKNTVACIAVAMQ